MRHLGYGEALFAAKEGGFPLIVTPGYPEYQFVPAPTLRKRQRGKFVGVTELGLRIRKDGDYFVSGTVVVSSETEPRLLTAGVLVNTPPQLSTDKLLCTMLGTLNGLTPGDTVTFVVNGVLPLKCGDLLRCFTSNRASNEPTTALLNSWLLIARPWWLPSPCKALPLFDNEGCKDEE
jgi:hypothetical protein